MISLAKQPAKKQHVLGDEDTKQEKKSRNDDEEDEGEESSSEDERNDEQEVQGLADVHFSSDSETEIAELVKF